MKQFWGRRAAVAFPTGVTRQMVFYGFRVRRWFVGIVFSGVQLEP